jgi:thiamine transporter ThiT
MSADRDAKREADLARWQKIRDQGPVRFILLRGMLGWGVTTGLLWCGLMTVFTEREFLPLLVAALIGFPIAGLVWGGAMWFRAEKQLGQAER